MNIAWIPLILAVSIFASLGNTLLKLGASRDVDTAPLKLSTLHHAMLRPAILAGIIMYSISQVLWITELRVVDLSLAYPLQVGLNFTLITGIAWLYLKEPLAVKKTFGIVLIFAGIVLITTG